MPVACTMVHPNIDGFGTCSKYAACSLALTGLHLVNVGEIGLGVASPTSCFRLVLVQLEPIDIPKTPMILLIKVMMWSYSQ